MEGANLVLSCAVARLESCHPDISGQRQGLTAPVVCLEDLSSPYAPVYDVMLGAKVFDPEWSGDVIESSCDYDVLLDSTYFRTFPSLPWSSRKEAASASAHDWHPSGRSRVVAISGRGSALAGFFETSRKAPEPMRKTR